MVPTRPRVLVGPPGGWGYGPCRGVPQGSPLPPLPKPPHFPTLDVVLTLQAWPCCHGEGLGLLPGALC